jgi:hypothetical protein
MQSQRHIRDHIFETVSEAENSGRTWEVCFVKETRTGYEFVDNSTLSVNGTSVLSTKEGGNTRWVSIYGKHELNKYAVPVLTFPCNTVFINEEEPGLTFDSNNELIMHLVPLEDI